MTVAQPKCPSCNVKGIDYIVSTESAEKAKNGDAWFDLAHCSECGHVYGVFNKISHTPKIEVPEFKVPNFNFNK